MQPGRWQSRHRLPFTFFWGTNMPIAMQSGRQELITATVDFAFSDVLDDTYAPAIELPGNAIVVGGYLAITEAFNSATTDQFSIGAQVFGEVANKTAYSGLSADFTTGVIPVVPTGADIPAVSTVGVVWNGAGAAPTAGAGRLVLTYAVKGRTCFSQGGR